MYPIEKYGWKYVGDDGLVYVKGHIGSLCFYRDNRQIRLSFNGVLDFNELQAIYKTAEQIRKENK